MLRKVARVRAGKNFRDSRVTFFEKFAIGRERGVLTILCGIGSCRVPRPSLADYVMGTETHGRGGRRRRSWTSGNSGPIPKFPLYSHIDSQ